MSNKENWLDPVGLYNPILRAAFTNISESPFTIMWDNKVVTTLKGGETVELPHYLAVVATKALVDSIMIGNAKMDEIAYYKANPNTQPNMYRAASSLGVPAARKVWEDKICRVLEVDEESPQVQVMRSQIREELMKDLKAEPSQGSPLQNAPASVTDFADLTAPKQEKVEMPSPIRVKKMGRPKAIKE